MDLFLYDGTLNPSHPDVTKCDNCTELTNNWVLHDSKILCMVCEIYLENE